MPDLQKNSDDADMIVCGYYLYFHFQVYPGSNVCSC